MKTMIFAAGLGTRFKPWTDKHPKALALVNGKSLLEHNVRYLQQYGITDLVINVHHHAEQVMEAVAEASGWGSQIQISDERGELLETGGGLLKAAELLKSDQPFLTLNADVLTDLNLYHILASHQKNKALITLAVTDRKSDRVFLMDSTNRLCGWKNNKTGEEIISIPEQHLHSMAYSCVAVFQPNVFEIIPQRGKFSLTETYLSLAADHLVQGYNHSGDRFVDVGKPESVEVAERMFVERWEV